MVTATQQRPSGTSERTGIYVRWFEELTKTDTAIAGGRAPTSAR
jgi:hypothetical protein